MILLLAILALSVLYMFRIPRLRRITADQFPDVDPQTVMQWRTLELRSIYALLLTTLVLLVITIGFMLFVMQQEFNLEDKHLKIVLVQADNFVKTLAIVGVIVAGNFGAQAGKLRKLHGLSLSKKK